MNFIDNTIFENIADFSYGGFFDKQAEPNVYHINKLAKKLNRTLILFINAERLNLLFSILKKTDVEVIIISHGSDTTLDTYVLDFIPKNVITLWAQNYNGPLNDKVKNIPIGLEIKRNHPEVRKHHYIKKFYDVGYKKEYDLYMNFNLNTHPDRVLWYDHFKDKTYIEKDSTMVGYSPGLESFLNFIDKVQKSKFVLSPPGKGIDCYRNWECFYLGSIPIIENSMFAKNMYEGFPILVVDDIKTITKKYLDAFYRDNKMEEKIESFRKDPKLTPKYWINLIKKDIKNERFL